MRNAGCRESVGVAARNKKQSGKRNDGRRMSLIGKNNAIAKAAGQALGHRLTYSAWMSFTIRAALVFSLAPFFLATANAQSVDRETALLNPRAIALNPLTGDVYAVAPRENAVMVFHKGTNSARRIDVGRGPVAVAVNPKTKRIYVANNESGSVSVIDGAAEAVTATLDVGANPYVLAVDSTSNRIFVSNTFSDVI